ncbi:DNA primase large subunit PriL [Candidatus Bathyarchaeota archaeon]|nr:DNA primase large subunit PriL [Candidatus Bathyarchaeota archaeon]
MAKTLTLEDMAKYPFMPEAAEEVRKLGFRIDGLFEADYAPILERAERRVIEALTNNPPEVRYDPSLYKGNVEMLSFPVAVALVTSLANEYVKRRYALAEARRAYDLLKRESEEKIVEIARKFGWRIRFSGEKSGVIKFDFALNFIDYLRNAASFHDKDWKLINKFVINGEVHLSKQEVARLLQEEIRRYIEGKIDPKIRSALPEKIFERAEKIKQAYSSSFKELPTEDFSPSEATEEAFPPCIMELYRAAQSGRHVPHVGRFALTSFLINIGMSPDLIVDLFRRSSDFNERMTRYQIEHIAGERGSGTKYTPPKCDTLQTHGLCPGMDDICRRIKHPLMYYRRKMRAMKAKRVKESKG